MSDKELGLGNKIRLKLKEIRQPVDPKLAAMARSAAALERDYSQLAGRKTIFFHSLIDEPTFNGQPFIHENGTGHFQESLGISRDTRTLQQISHYLDLKANIRPNPDQARLYRSSFGMEFEQTQSASTDAADLTCIDYMPLAKLGKGTVPIGEVRVAYNRNELRFLKVGEQYVLFCANWKDAGLLHGIPIVGTLSPRTDVSFDRNSLPAVLSAIVHAQPKDANAQEAASKIDTFLLKPLQSILNSLKTGHLPEGAVIKVPS